MVAVSALPAQAAPKSDKMSVRDNVRWFYAWYVGQINDQKDPLADRAKIAKFTSRRLNRWLHSSQYADYGADYFLQAQDFDADWTRATVNAVTIEGNRARVAATLGVFKAEEIGIGPRKLNLKMIKENGAWKIDSVSALKN